MKLPEDRTYSTHTEDRPVTCPNCGHKGVVKAAPGDKALFHCRNGLWGFIGGKEIYREAGCGRSFDVSPDGKLTPHPLDLSTYNKLTRIYPFGCDPKTPSNEVGKG